MRLLSAINAALFFAIAIKGIWDHNPRVLVGSVLCLVIWAIIYPDLTDQNHRR